MDKNQQSFTTLAACWPLGPTTMPARRRHVEFDLVAFAEQRPLTGNGLLGCSDVLFLCIEPVDSGLRKPDSDWKEPEKEKRDQIIAEDSLPASLCQGEALSHKIYNVEQAKYGEEMEGQDQQYPP
ncbi:MAG TPA: hypothetical protein VGS15_11160 [Candidatus Acidoferrales bacterium]|nr:hypothetical protein [Candidatus Acidoferrales bacterium]